MASMGRKHASLVRVRLLESILAGGGVQGNVEGFAIAPFNSCGTPGPECRPVVLSMTLSIFPIGICPKQSLINGVTIVGGAWSLPWTTAGSGGDGGCVCLYSEKYIVSRKSCNDMAFLRPRKPFISFHMNSMFAEIDVR
jgi:hypothetical protein